MKHQKLLAVVLSAAFLAACKSGGGGDDATVPTDTASILPTARVTVTSNAAVGATVTLDASTSSAPTDKSLTYAWTLIAKPTGSSATLTAPTSARPTLTTDREGNYIASLVVNDGNVNSAAVSVSIAAVVQKVRVYVDHRDGTVTDSTTGLTWMRCPMGRKWTGTMCAYANNRTTYDAQSAARLSGTVNFAGYSDWRVPNIRELGGLIDRSRYGLPIDADVFPIDAGEGDGGGRYFWTTTAASTSGGYWAVVFAREGVPAEYANSNEFRVLLVRESQTSARLLHPARPSADYVDNGDGTVTHSPTDLMWQRCARGQTWGGGTCSGNAATHTWDAASVITDNLAGHADWRLPTIDELESLVDYTASYPALNATIFPTTPVSSFWSSSVPGVNQDVAWQSFFTNGSTMHGAKSSSYPVRLVRKAHLSIDPLTPPSVPTIGVATPDNESVSVAFAASINTDGSAIRHYTVKASPGEKAASGSTSPIVVSGLTNGIAYTFTVTATNSAGISSSSRPTQSVTPLDPWIKTYIKHSNSTVTNATTGLMSMSCALVQLWTGIGRVDHRTQSTMATSDSPACDRSDALRREGQVINRLTCRVQCSRP